jgi:hypothetical protein
MYLVRPPPQNKRGAAAPATADVSLVAMGDAPGAP